MSRHKLWSVTRITNNSHPGVTVRVGEFAPGGSEVHVDLMKWMRAFPQACRARLFGMPRGT